MVYRSRRERLRQKFASEVEQKNLVIIRTTTQKHKLKAHGMLRHMRRMGIDFGTKKIGLALSDESGSMAFPHSVITNDNQLLSTIVTLIEAESVSEIVIGHSLDKDGKENIVHELVKEFITDLSLEVPVPVHLEPEQFSTQQAKQLQGQHKKIDASAAAIILQSYLDRLKSSSAFDELNY